MEAKICRCGSAQVKHVSIPMTPTVLKTPLGGESHGYFAPWDYYECEDCHVSWNEAVDK